MCDASDYAVGEVLGQKKVRPSSCYILEKIPYMPQQIAAHVLHVIKNVNLSSMPKVVIFHVLYAISVRCN
jgi:hypothetical protein